MARFLLVHGRHHGAWCWDRVASALRERRHEVVAIDLPGQGDDETPPAQVTARSTIDRIVDALAPGTVLVGHSLGGFWSHRAAGEAPDMVGKMVYLATLVPQQGESWAETVERWPGSVIDNTLDDEGQAIVVPPDYESVVYNRCSPEDVAMALSRCRPLPFASLAEVGMTPEPYPAHPSAVAIVCEDDRAQPPDIVEASAKAAGVPVRRTPGDHSAFFSAVEPLVDLLDEIAAG